MRRALFLAACLLLTACAEPTAVEYGCGPVDTIAADAELVTTVQTCVHPRLWPPR